MKIGIITFHWGANHGAVLQAYASQKYLEKSYPDYEVDIVNYFPLGRESKLKNMLHLTYPKVMLKKIGNIKKNKRIEEFRKELKLSKRYYSNKELIDNTPDYDYLLCGSDQIWNPSYLKYGEGKITPVYFLNFGKEGCKKASLSVSFGCTKYPEDLKETAKEHIEKLDMVSVREKTGLSILESMGLDGVWTADPTALLSGEDYKKICSDVKEDKSDIGYLVLRSQSKKNKKIIKKLLKKLKAKKVRNMEMLSMKNWMATIRDSEAVVTNSFHVIMLCLKLHTPFYAILEDGKSAGMNDRLITLLEYFSLEDRIVNDEDKVNGISDVQKIDWDKVDEKMESYSETLRVFLKNFIK